MLNNNDYSVNSIKRISFLGWIIFKNFETTVEPGSTCLVDSSCKTVIKKTMKCINIDWW